MKWPRLILALSLLISLYPLTAQAATTLSVSPGSVQTEIGKTFSVNININAGEAINAASGTVSYPTAILDVSSISLSGSIFSFWTDTPSSGSSITFGGGLPNPGHVGSGKLFSITFKAKAAGSGTISITNGKVLANNGSGSNVFSSASSSSVSVGEQLAGLSISSSSHPSQSKWYKTRQLILNWSKPSDVTNFEYSLSGPTSKNDSTAGNSVTFNDLEDGVWTFKLTGKSKKGDRSATFKAQIDNVAPEKFTVEVKSSGKTDPFPILIYSATDALSGIDRYEIVIGNSEAKTTTETTYKTERQTPGKKTVKVIAYDKAGNSTEATTEFEIEGFPGPVITDYSRFVSVLQPVELKGKALFEARIDLYVNGKKEAEFMVKDNLIDPSTATNLKDGDEANWVYTYKGTLLPGKHSFYATQTKPDSSESAPSNTVTTRVLWSSIALGGVILPLFLVLLILIAIIIGLLFLLWWVWRHSGHAVVGWKNRLTALRKRVDEELGSMEKDVSRAAEEFAGKPKTLRNQLDSEIRGSINTIDSQLETVIQQAEIEEIKDSKM